MNDKISCGGFIIDGQTLLEENGVLKVNDSSLSGTTCGKKNFDVEFIYDYDTFKYSADKSFEEIKEAYEEDDVHVRFYNSSEDMFYEGVILAEDQSKEYFIGARIFINLNASPIPLVLERLKYNENNTIEYDRLYFELTEIN